MGEYVAMNEKKSLEDVKKYVERIAERKNWILNKDNDTFEVLIEGLHQNINHLGYYNCPCRDSENNNKLDNDIICPCKYANQDIQEFGYCYCSLYFDPSFDFSKKIVMIPERRPEKG
jgi:ferredoxin-thioredoxin reductase catalytic subunit